MQGNAQLLSVAGRVFITMSVTCRLLHKCKVWSWTSSFWWPHAQSRLNTTVIGVQRESWGLKGLSSVCCLHLVRSVITKTLCFFNFLVWGLLTQMLDAIPYCRLCNFCTLLQLIPPIHLLSLAQLLSTHSPFLTFLFINSFSDLILSAWNSKSQAISFPY